MSLSIPTQIAVPFATSGLKDTIPANSDNVTGRAGYDQGFPPVNMTPKVAGGIPPFGEDMNGILFDVTKAVQFLESGTGFVYNSTFSTAIGGYNAGARVLRTDGRGYWLNTTNGNTTDPESAGGSAAGWVPDYTNGISSITMTNANVTLTALQYGRPIIVITGTLTANLNLIFPSIAGQWIVLNNTTGAFTITCKTASGSGVVVTGSTSVFGDGTNIYFANSASLAAFNQIQSITATVNGTGGAPVNGMRVTVNPTTLDFRSATLSNGLVTNIPLGIASSIDVVSGATLGALNGVLARFAVLEINNSGSLETAIANMAGGINLTETGVITTVAMTAASDSASVVYSAVARTNVPYRFVGYIENTQATAGTYVTAPSKVQGAGGNALSMVATGRSWATVTGSRVAGTTYYNTAEWDKEVIIVSNAGASLQFSILVDGVGRDTTAFSGTSGIISVKATVPPGSAYSLTTAAGTVNVWSELG